MDITRFQQLVENPSLTLAQLVTMRTNALSQSAVEHVHLVERALEHRFPGWRTVRTRRGGSNPTEAMFMGKTRRFETQKEAYVWLMERFIQYYPKPFEQIDRQTVFVAAGARTLYFARSLKNLFGTSLADSAEPCKYHRLTNGWYAKVVLSEHQKIELLEKFAAVAGLRIGRDWDWNGRSKVAPFVDVDTLLAKFKG